LRPFAPFGPPPARPAAGGRTPERLFRPASGGEPAPALGLAGEPFRELGTGKTAVAAPVFTRISGPERQKTRREGGGAARTRSAPFGAGGLGKTELFYPGESRKGPGPRPPRAFDGRGLSPVLNGLGPEPCGPLLRSLRPGASGSRPSVSPAKSLRARSAMPGWFAPEIMRTRPRKSPSGKPPLGDFRQAGQPPTKNTCPLRWAGRFVWDDEMVKTVLTDF